MALHNQHNSLPRKTHFQRNAPARRSAGAEPLIEYFVPRSVSEFDLSCSSNELPLAHNMLPLTVRMARKPAPKPRGEKMVTFEDELLEARNHQELQDVFM